MLKFLHIFSSLSHLSYAYQEGRKCLLLFQIIQRIEGNLNLIFSFVHQIYFSFPPFRSTNKIKGPYHTMGTSNTSPLCQKFLEWKMPFLTYD